MKNFYLGLALLIPTATLFSMETPYHNSLKENGAEEKSIYDFRDIPQEKNLDLEHAKTLKKKAKKSIDQFIQQYNAKEEELASKERNISSLTFKLKNVALSGDKWDKLEEILFQNLQDNPLLLQEQPDIIPNLIKAMENAENSELSDDEYNKLIDSSKLWLAAVEGAHKKTKTMQDPLITAMAKRTSAAIIPTLALVSPLFAETKLIRQYLPCMNHIAEGIHQGTVAICLARLAYQQKPKTTRDYLSMVPVIGSSGIFAICSIGNFFHKNIFTTKAYAYLVGESGSKRFTITDVVATSLAALATFKWLWDYQDETRRDYIKLCAVQTYEEKVVKPFKNLRERLLQKQKQIRDNNNH